VTCERFEYVGCFILWYEVMMYVDCRLVLIRFLHTKNIPFVICYIRIWFGGFNKEASVLFLDDGFAHQCRHPFCFNHS